MRLPRTPSSLVLDTSVIIKWFRQEEKLANYALQVRRAYLNEMASIYIPSLVAYEVANVLRYKNELTAAQVEEAVQSLFDMGLEWIEPSAALMRRAVVIARECDITVYDASFIALAEILNGEFITADRQLVLGLSGFPFVRFLGDSLSLEC